MEVEYWYIESLLEDFNTNFVIKNNLSNEGKGVNTLLKTKHSKDNTTKLKTKKKSKD